MAVLVALLLVVAACGGGGGSSTTITTTATTTTTVAVTTTTQAGFEVTSEDGDLTVEVPVEAMASDPGITISLLAPADFPPELAGAADDPDARIYDLGPEGLEFAAPVTVTRRLDASRFEGLTADMVPLVAMITRTADGTYEPYDDLRVTRRGDDIFVSGTTTHFSPAIAVDLGQYVESYLDDAHLGYATEKGSGLQVGYRFYRSDLTALDAPATYEPVGYTRSSALEFGATGPMLDVRCLDIGDAMPRLGVRLTLEAGAPESQVGLRTLPLLNPALERIEIMAKNISDFYCLDPATSIIIALTVFALTIFTDHPGGTAYIPNEEFYGGLSGAKLRFSYSERLQGAWAGLICDNDNDGQLDPTDTWYAPWSLERNGDALEYVAPLYGYGNYFVYVVDGMQYSGKPEGREWSVGQAVSLFRDMYTGLGRFESSIGLVASDLGLFQYRVGPEEGETTVGDAYLEQAVIRTTFQF
ncbi:MAG: hypothetical protein HZA58_04475 [Acidimicrobiia bacterium]|nr:hypothetical protein [Acidimicrobiia bacterium]